jgi:hypothetical protein
MNKTMITILLLAVAFTSNAQSLFAPLPKPKWPVPSHGLAPRDVAPPNGATGTAIGNIYSGFRFDGPSVLVAIPDFTVYTGVGLSYEHDTYRDSTAKWYTDWSVAFKGYAGGQYAPGTVSGVTAVGLSVSFFNKLLTVGVLYNFMTKKAQAGAGPTVNLIN